MYRSAFLKKLNDHRRIVLTAIMGMILGYFLGVSFPYLSFPKINLHPSFLSPFDMHGDHHERSFPENLVSSNTPELPMIYVPTNPRGAESLPPAIVVLETDLYLRRLWGKPSEDLKTNQNIW